jgi:hypothetical protein
VGSLGATGLTLPALLKSQQAQAKESETPAGSSFGRAKSVILFWLNGGPPQMETWDPKPEAPSATRSEFGTIASKTPGLDVCELMPQVAQLTDKIAVLRAVVSHDRSHSSSGYQMLTGVPHIPLSRESVTAKAPNLSPSVAAMVRALRAGQGGLPSSITIPEHVWNDGNFPWPGQDAGFLGRKHDPWLIHCDPSQQNFKIPDLSLPDDMPALRFERRRSLLQQVNSHLDHLESNPMVKQFDRDTQQAYGLLTASKSRDAFDLNSEPDSVRDRYGRTRYAQSVLLSRRLIKSGVSLVQVNWTRMKGHPNQGGWDTHATNAKALKDHLMPIMDRAFSALITDLEERGLLDETLVAWVGEFGRTPKINARAGRDHWGNCFSIALAGGGIKGGQVYGSSDKQAGYPVSGMVEPRDITATIFHCLGYRPETVLHDTLNRPFAISRGNPIQAIL